MLTHIQGGYSPNPSRSISSIIDDLAHQGFIAPITEVAGVIYHAGAALVNAVKQYYGFTIDEQDLRVLVYTITSACQTIKGYIVEP